ncbi:glycosyltransferase family 2 protein [uncultured Microbacterium sp.]|nr:glycosyltransferase [uncultured Microbacterium sp.]
MSPNSLIVAVLTFRRPDQLDAALNALCERVREAADRVEAEILVVDNDPVGSAWEVAQRVRAHPVRYVVEGRPGIAAARNRALDEAEGSRLLVFIDDDEIAQPAWLTSLVDTWIQTGADAVQGRLVTSLPLDADPYIAAGGFFDRAIHPSGTPLAAAATYNLLLDLDTVRRLGLRFDEGLGLTGGEDSIFTSLLIRGGGRIVACSDAVAVDPLAPERATRSWVRQRAFSQGTVLQNTRLELATSGARRFRVRTFGIVGGMARLAFGLGGDMLGAVSGNIAQRARGERVALRGLGVLARSLGYRHRTYRRHNP